jgi:hypothetical protein
MADGLDPERVLLALTHPVYGPWLRALGVLDVSGFGDDDYKGEAQWPPWNEPQIRQVVDEMFGADESSDVREEYGPWPRVKAEKAARLRVETRRGRGWIASEVGWSERQVGYLIDLLERDPPALIWDEEDGLQPGTLWDTKGVPGGRSILVKRSNTA